MVVGADAWYTATATATAVKGTASSVLQTQVGTATGVNCTLNVSITTATAPELSDGDGHMYYIVGGTRYASSSADAKAVGKYAVTVSFAMGDDTIWASSYADKSNDWSENWNLTLAAKAQVSGKVGMVLLAQNASTGADPAEEVTHVVNITIAKNGGITLNSVNGNTDPKQGEFALRPASEDETSAEASMPSGGYTDSYLGSSPASFMEIKTCTKAGA